METPTKFNYSPSNILTRLEELKKWQKEQHERLIAQQNQQRQLLSSEQRRMCEAFNFEESPILSKSQNSAALSSTIKETESKICDSQENNPSSNENIIKIIKKNSDIVHSVPNDKDQQFDDIPINQMSKSNFKLPQPISAPDIDSKPKFKFLKRGEGIARFKMAPKKKKCFNRQTNSTNSKNTEKNSFSNGLKNVKIERSKDPPTSKITEAPTWKCVTKSNAPPLVIENTSEDINSNSALRPLLARHNEINAILNNLRSKKDQDELKMFELLEEKAASSSFCSNSSTIQNMLESDVNSTPQIEKLIRKKIYQDYGISLPGFDDHSTPEVSPVKLTSKTNRVRFKEFPSPIKSDSPNKAHNSPTEDASENQFNDDTAWSDNSCLDDTEKISVLHPPKSFSDAAINTDTKCADETNENIEKLDADAIFKSQILKSRLEQLDNEIEIFRQENSNLQKKKSDLEEEKKKFYQEKHEKEKSLAEEKIRFKHYLDEEKAKLAKEKMVFEKYTKELKNQPSRKEREEITALKNEIVDLKEQIKVKDSKHGAQVARFRTQVKNLERQVVRLKTENESLVKENKKLQSQQRPISAISQTKMLHEINKNISKMMPKELKSVIEAKQKLASFKQQQIKNPTKKSSKLDSTTNSDSEYVSDEDDEEENLPSRKTENAPKTIPVVLQDLPTESESDEDHDISDPNNGKPIEQPRLIEQTLKKTLYGPPSSRHSYFPESINEENDANQLNTQPNKCQDSSLGKQKSQIELEYEKTFGNSDNIVFPSINSNVGNLKPKRHETVFPDGRKEIRYSNGALKIVSPDGNLIKFIHHNGDIKDVDLNAGTIKYFYAKTKAWHTQYPDGFEVLDFPNGQIEKRYKDGRCEVDFPNGCRKIIDSYGNQKLEYPDGTVVTTERNGDKTYTFPNGEREFHTKTHKRREFPDGTVKIQYPDGKTETRYASGRIRIKDNNGKLLMDTGD